MKPAPPLPPLPEPLEEARQKAAQFAQETQDRVRAAGEQAQERVQERVQGVAEKAREAQERAREAQERAVELARERVREAAERARRAREAAPPGLLVRIGSALVGLPLLIALVFAQGPRDYFALPFACAVIICASVGQWEFFRMARERQFRPSEGLAYGAVVLLQLAAWSVSRGHLSGFLPALLAGLVIATMVHQVLRRDPEPLQNIGVTFLSVVYVGWLFSFLIFLRSTAGMIPVSPGLPPALTAWLASVGFQLDARGAWLVLYVIAVTWSTDTGAYLIGMRWGKHGPKLAPNLSPNKSVIGAVGGLLSATVMSLVLGQWIGLPWYHCLVLGPALGTLGQVGDLCESALKRDFGVKDAGGLLPGHGGILDRFDSLLFTAPVAFYYLSFWGLAGPGR